MDHELDFKEIMDAAVPIANAMGEAMAPVLKKYADAGHPLHDIHNAAAITILAACWVKASRLDKANAVELFDSLIGNAIQLNADHPGGGGN